MLHPDMFVKSKQYPSERYFQGKHHLLSYLYLRWVSISSVLLCARANHRIVTEGTLPYHTQELTFMIAISKVQVPSCTLQTQQSRAEQSVCASWPLTSCVLGWLQPLLLPKHCEDQDVAGLSLI